MLFEDIMLTSHIYICSWHLQTVPQMSGTHGWTHRRGSSSGFVVKIWSEKIKSLWNIVLTIHIHGRSGHLQMVPQMCGTHEWTPRRGSPDGCVAKIWSERVESFWSYHANVPYIWTFVTFTDGSPDVWHPLVYSSKRFTRWMCGKIFEWKC